MAPPTLLPPLAPQEQVQLAFFLVQLEVLVLVVSFLLQLAILALAVSFQVVFLLKATSWAGPGRNCHLPNVLQSAQNTNQCWLARKPTGVASFRGFHLHSIVGVGT